MGALRRNFNAGHNRRRWMDRAVFGRGASESVLRGGGVPAITDLNFVADTYLINGVSASFTSAFTCSRTTTLSYYTTAAGVLTTFGPNTARIGTRGLLMEPNATNICLKSQVYTTGTWGSSNQGVTDNFTAAPDGTTTAAKVLCDAGNAGQHILSQNITAAGTIYTASTHLKMGTHRYVELRLDDQSAHGAGVVVDLQTGLFKFNTIVGSQFVQTDRRIEPLADGWFKVSLSLTTNATTPKNIATVFSDGVTTTWNNIITGAGTESYFVWGHQLEASGYVTSYIPTAAASASRQGDIISSIDTADTIGWRKAEGTYFVDGEILATGTTIDNFMCIVRNLNFFDLVARTDSVDWRVSSVPDLACGATPSRFTFAGNWTDGGTHAAALNGVFKGTAGPGNITGTPGLLDIAHSNRTNTHMYMRRFAFWQVRVPDTDLVNVGAPSWVTKGEGYFADLDYDFVMNRANSLGTITTATAILSCTRASAGYAVNTAGVLIPFAANTPRLTNKGLLIERAATNYCLASNSIDFGTGNWALYGPPGGGTTTPNFATAPDGTQTATLLSVEIGNGMYNTVGGLTQLTAYRYSMFFKVASGPGLLYNWNGVNNTDITSGTPYANGWYRLEGALTTGAGETSAQALFTIIHPDFAQSDIYVWGAQFEAKDISTTPASSLITTTTTAVTRPVDHVGVTVEGQQVGTWYVSGNFVINVTGINPRLISEGVSLLYMDTTGTTIGQFPPNITVSPGSGDARNLKAAVAFRPGARSICANNGTVSTDTNTADTVNNILLFGQSGGDNDVINGYITRVSRFGGIKLADATLQSLTTL